MLWWTGSRWTWAFGIQQDRKTTTDSAHFHTHRRYDKKNRQCCVMFHPLWLFKYQRCPYIILGHLEWTKKFRKKGTHYTFCMTWTQELVLLPAGSESYRQWLYCFLFSRMCFSSAFRSWVRPRLKTSVPRWVDEAQRGCADLFDDTAWIFFSLQGWLRLMFILIFIVFFFYIIIHFSAVIYLECDETAKLTYLLSLETLQLRRIDQILWVTVVWHLSKYLFIVTIPVDFITKRGEWIRQPSVAKAGGHLVPEIMK